MLGNDLVQGKWGLNFNFVLFNHVWLNFYRILIIKEVLGTPILVFLEAKIYSPEIFFCLKIHTKLICNCLSPISTSNLNIFSLPTNI